MCHNPTSGGNGETKDPYEGPVLLVYNIPDPQSRIGGWKIITIDLPSYDSAVYKSFELPRVAWGEIRTFNGNLLIEKFGDEER